METEGENDMSMVVNDKLRVVTSQSIGSEYNSEADFSASDMELSTPAVEKPSPQFHSIGAQLEEPRYIPQGSELFNTGDVVELARCSWRGSRNNQKFLKGCLWSPDGTCVLTAINGEGMQVFELPHDLYSTESVDIDRPVNVLQNAIHVPEGGTIYDYCWYPFMNSSDPGTCW